MKKHWPQGYRSAGFFVRYRRTFVLNNNNILLSDFQKKGFKMIHNLKVESCHTVYRNIIGAP
jgi:hypothetical protein